MLYRSRPPIVQFHFHDVEIVNHIHHHVYRSYHLNTFVPWHCIPHANRVDLFESYQVIPMWHPHGLHFLYRPSIMQNLDSCVSYHSQLTLYSFPFHHDSTEQVAHHTLLCSMLQSTKTHHLFHMPSLSLLILISYPSFLVYVPSHGDIYQLVSHLMPLNLERSNFQILMSILIFYHLVICFHLLD